MMRFFKLLVLLFCVQISVNAQPCHPQDSLELVKFYNAVNGQNSTLDWVLTQPVKTWEWVKLTPNGRVKSLWLIGKNLSGVLPADLSLPELTLLGLSNNKIGGTLSKFDLLPKLRELELPNNQLTGSIPNYDSPILQDLELNNNQLTGSIPKFNLPNLIGLYLNNNQLTGEIPAFETPLLGGLHLEHNQLTGSIPDFKNMPKLQWLQGNNNQLSGKLPSFSSLVNLEWLYFYNNYLTGEMPDFQLPKLRSLDLHSNQLSGKIPAWDLPKLYILTLRNNELSGKMPDWKLPLLFNLDVSQNQLSGAVPDFKTEKLKILHVENNRFTFEGLEIYQDTNIWFTCSPQARIPIQVAGKWLSVSAGGTLANNTYFWYKNDELVFAIEGDSTFDADTDGEYFCVVQNSILSDTSFFDSLFLMSETRKIAVSVDEIAGKRSFSVLPNPVYENQPLQISLENDFFGMVKFEILSLDGRVLEIFFEEKNSHRMTQSHPMTVATNSFFVRVSDGKTSETQLVLKL